MDYVGSREARQIDRGAGGRKKRGKKSWEVQDTETLGKSGYNLIDCYLKDDQTAQGRNSIASTPIHFVSVW